MSGQVIYKWRLVMPTGPSHSGEGEYYGGDVQDCMVGAMSHTLADVRAVMANQGVEKATRFTFEMEVQPWTN